MLDPLTDAIRPWDVGEHLDKTLQLIVWDHLTVLSYLMMTWGILSLKFTPQVKKLMPELVLHCFSKEYNMAVEPFRDIGRRIVGWSLVHSTVMRLVWLCLQFWGRLLLTPFVAHAVIVNVLLCHFLLHPRGGSEQPLSCSDAWEWCAWLCEWECKCECERECEQEQECKWEWEQECKHEQDQECEHEWDQEHKQDRECKWDWECEHEQDWVWSGSEQWGESLRSWWLRGQDWWWCVFWEWDHVKGIQPWAAWEPCANLCASDGSFPGSSNYSSFVIRERDNWILTFVWQKLLEFFEESAVEVVASKCPKGCGGRPPTWPYMHTE